MSYHDRDYMRAGPPTLGEWLKGLTAFQWLLILNLGLFFAQWLFGIGWLHDALNGEPVRPLGGLSVDALAAGHFWTPFTHLFVHGNWASFLANMLLFWFAGRRVQELYGSRNFLWIYFVSGLGGAAVEMAMSAYVQDTTQAVLMGPSAAVLGLLLAYAVAMPEEEIPLLCLSLRTFAILILAGNVILAGLALGADAVPHWLRLVDIASFAHLGGALAGWYFARSLGYGGIPPHLLQPQMPVGSTLRRRPEMARARRQRPMVEVDMEAVRRENPRNDPLVSLMKDEIDPILDKINDHGIGSLTEDERRALERASRRFSK